MTKADLADRIEELDGPDREIDVEIVRALYPDAIIDLYCVGDAENTVFHAEPLIPNKSELPHYTASIDAAMTLVPDGDFYPGASQNKHHGHWFCWMHANEEEFFVQATAKTQPLAICAAALRAQEKTDG